MHVHAPKLVILLALIPALLLACAPPGPQSPTAVATPVAQASPSLTTPAQPGSPPPAVPPATPSFPTLDTPTVQPSPTTAAGPAPDDWADSSRGHPASTRHNPTALTLPLALLWEWGDADTGRPAALVTLGDRLYVLTDRGNLHLLDANGRELAQTNLWAEAEGGPGTLVATGDSVVASVSRWITGRNPAYPAHVLGLDRAGQQRWMLEVPGDQGPCDLLADEGLVAVASAGSSNANWLSIRDATTGQERWRQAYRGYGYFHLWASDGTALYVTGAESHLIAYDWTTGQERWRQTDERLRGVQFAAVDQGRLYVLVVAGPAWALDAASGQILWQSRFGNASRLAVAHGHVYVAQGTGKFLHALDADTGAQRWQWTVPEGEDVDYIAAGRTHVLVVTYRAGAGQQASTLHLLDPATGQEQGRVPLTWWEPRPLAGGLAIAHGRVYAASDRLRTYAQHPGG